MKKSIKELTNDEKTLIGIISSSTNYDCIPGKMENQVISLVKKRLIKWVRFKEGSKKQFRLTAHGIKAKRLLSDAAD